MEAPKFHIRFPLSDVGMWSRRYRYADTTKLEDLGKEALARGAYTRAGLLEIARWKTRGRSVSRCATNTDADVRRASDAALRAHDEARRIEALVALRGVGYPTASVLLHFAHPARYPILDVRALWSLGQSGEPRSYSTSYWLSYVEACRDIAAAAHESIRTLDRALWAYSKANQGRIGITGRGRSKGITALGKAPRRTAATPKGAFPTETYRVLIDAAIDGRTIVYSDLPGSRRTWGRDLFAIAPFEADHGRPPLTALVVHKHDGRPGAGFVEAMGQVGFDRREGESDLAFWHRAVSDVHAFWRGRPRPRTPEQGGPDDRDT